ncbi:MAG TPA: hypothetical protein VGZ48_14065 [Candidatus Acidoferrales bacterium]|nr:hypothetical protein [Candidatus Acidoferrales bacterium]
MAKTRLDCLWNKPSCTRGYRSGVSLHSHTNRSKECLQFVPEFAEKFHVLKWALDRKCRTAVVPVDFDRAYWTPPMSPRQSLELESKQIEDTLGLASIISLTDHDNFEASRLLRLIPQARPVPFSLEWSAPFRGTVFHLGIHNLPEGKADGVMADLAANTREPNEVRLKELLSLLNQEPDVLVVFNHPLWKQRATTGLRHAQVVDQFLEENHMYFHAIELNGTRTWKENYPVLQLAERWKLPAVSGGDRHATEPSAALNLTRAETFTEFIHEIRYDGLSHMVFMPQYQDPMGLRMTRFLLDIVREYPENPVGSRRWDDRVFHPGRPREVMQPLSALWRKPPEIITKAFALIGLVENDAVGHALKAMMAQEEGSPRLTDFSSEAIW